ncbi:MAG: SUMF1/EgtB/PvdO family nonheme iron enzyme [Treponema sp.]|jgi:formylglycine-generating enzyme required for sulfatase activity|nr:SUMF1/EgtB/PvdO family nonheme iron enzyme [Treponema sp.]
MFFRPVEIKNEDLVRLKPVFGIKPGICLAVLYGGILLLILFFVLIYPGLSKPGSLVLFSSEPAGAAVRVDGITLGYTPCEIFVPRGSRGVEFILPRFEADRREINVKGRIFASLFLPRRLSVSGTLVSPDPAAAFAGEAAEYIYWSFAGEPTEGYQIPPALSEGAYRVGPAAADTAVREEMKNILAASLRYARTGASLRDFLRAKFLVDNQGLSASPLTLLLSLREAAAGIDGVSGAAPWLAEVLSQEAAAVLAGSAWFTQNAGTAKPSAGVIDLPLQLPLSLKLGEVDFISLPPGYLERNGRREAVPPLYIAQEPVSLDAWEAFTAENPRWAPGNREALIASRLVQEDYLVSPDNPAYPAPAAPGISWYAAAAYCSWLSAKLPSSLEGWEIRLPTEAEWEFAFSQYGSPKNGSSGGFSAGKLWEWCADPYAPLDFFPLPEKALAALEKTEPQPETAEAGRILDRSVRGGSWVNPPGSVDPAGSRGSLPPDTSSPFTGFRPVIVPRPGNTAE